MNHADNPNAPKSIEKMLRRLNSKECLQALRSELKFILDGLGGIESEGERNTVFEKIIRISLKKCNANVLVVGKANHRQNLILSEKQQKAFIWFLPMLVKGQRTFNEQSKAEPGNQNIKIKLEGNSDDKYYWFVEKGMNDYQAWSVLTCARKDGKSKPEKSVPPMRLVELNKSNEESLAFFPGTFDRAPPNLNAGIEPKPLKRITVTETLKWTTATDTGPAKPVDVIKNLSSAKNQNLCRVICSELASAMEFHGENKGQFDVEKLIDVHLAICFGMLKGEDEREVCKLLFPPLMKARIAAGKQFQENPSVPDIQVPLEGDFGGQFSLFVEKKYGGQFFLFIEKCGGDQADVTGVRKELIQLGMPDKHELQGLSLPPSRPVPAVPKKISAERTFKFPQIEKTVVLSKKESPDLSLPQTPIRTSYFPQLRNPTFSNQLPPSPGLNGTVKFQSRQGISLNKIVMQLPERPGNPDTGSAGIDQVIQTKKIIATQLTPREDKSK